VLADVYNIPCLTANIVSHGQLEEDGHKIMLHGGFLKIWDHIGCAVAKAKHVVCSLAHRRSASVSCCTGNQHGVAMACKVQSFKLPWPQASGQEGMVEGLPRINQIDQVSDSCLARKQSRHSFPGETNYRARNTLEHVHDNLCGP
jgi:hypothetical protein